MANINNKKIISLIYEELNDQDFSNIAELIKDSVKIRIYEKVDENNNRSDSLKELMGAIDRYLGKSFYEKSYATIKKWLKKKEVYFFSFFFFYQL